MHVLNLEHAQVHQSSNEEVLRRVSVSECFLCFEEKVMES